MKVIIDNLAWGDVNGYVVGLLVLLAVTVILLSIDWSWLLTIAGRKHDVKPAQLSVGSSVFVAVKGIAAISLLSAFFFHPHALDALNAAHVSSGVIRSYSVCVTLLVGYILILLISRIILFNYGDRIEKEGKTTYEINNKSRRFTIVCTLLLLMGMLLVVINILHAGDFLKASGILAVAMAVFGISHGAWLPDYMHGLVILFSEIYKKGDVIIFTEGDKNIYSQVYNVKAFHTELITFSDRNRVMIRHARMRDFTIRNLSRAGGSKGLREQIIFKIGYNVLEVDVRKMFNDAFKKIEIKESIPIEKQHDHEVRMFAAGDHAVWWIVYYHTKNNKELLRTKQDVSGLILETSIEHNISLSTPLTHSVDLNTEHDTDSAQADRT